MTGLVAQQQCVGPLHTPLADVAVTALSYLDKVKRLLIGKILPLYGKRNIFRIEDMGRSIFFTLLSLFTSPPKSSPIKKKITGEIFNLLA